MLRFCQDYGHLLEGSAQTMPLGQKLLSNRQFSAFDMIPLNPQYASSLRLRKHLDASKSKVKGMLGVPGMLRG